MSPLVLLARRELGRHALRSALTVGGVACGVALVVAIQAVNASTLAAFTEAIEDLAGTAALQVRGPGAFPEAVADQVRELPGVDHAVPILTATFFGVDPPVAGEALSVFAADVTDGHAIRTLKLVRAGDQVVDDPLGFLVDPHSVVLTDVFAARIDAHDGTRLRLRTPIGIATFTVRGILPPGGVGRAYAGNLLLMDVIGAQTVLGRERQIDQVDVTLDPGIAVEDAEATIRAALDPTLDVMRPSRRGEQIERYLASFQTLLTGVSALALLAAVFLIASAVAASVAARRREIALLRCAGARARDVVRLVVSEAVLVGALGTSLGIPLGMLLARLMLDAVGESTELIFSLASFRKRLVVDPAAIALGIAAGLGAAIVAAWMPARDAVAIPPVAAVRAGVLPARRAQWPSTRAIVLALLVTALAVALEIGWESAWAGNLAALATDIALVAIAVRCAGPLAGALMRPVQHRLGFAGRLAASRLTQIPDQLALAAAVLGLGLGIMIMAGTLARSFEESVVDFIAHQVRADLVVASTATTGWIESPLDEVVGERLAALPGVARVERLRLAEHLHEGERISIDSLDLPAFAPERADDFRFAAGDPAKALAAVHDGTGVLVSRNLARRLHLALGASLTLATPAGAFTTRVAGIVVDYVSPRGSIVLARPTYLRWWSDHGVTRYHVWLDPGAARDAVRTTIAQGVGAEFALKVLTQAELYAYHRDAVRRAFRLTRAIELLPLVVAGLGLAEALLAVSLDRRRELGLLRAVGATRGQIARSVVGEALGVGLLGLTTGVAIGVALAQLWVRVNFTYQLGWEIDFHLAPSTFLLALVAAVLVSVPAGLLPARRMARMAVRDALGE